MKRYIKVPSDIRIVDLSTNQPLFLVQGGEQKPWIISFKGFVCGTLLKDPRFGKTVVAVISGAGIRAAIETALSSVQAEAVIPLDGDDYELLKSVLEAPESGYVPEVAIQLIPFFRAILDASTTDPRAEAA
jgi:hypothetical protein